MSSSLERRRPATRGVLRHTSNKPMSKIATRSLLFHRLSGAIPACKPRSLVFSLCRYPYRRSRTCRMPLRPLPMPRSSRSTRPARHRRAGTGCSRMPRIRSLVVIAMQRILTRLAPARSARAQRMWKSGRRKGGRWVPAVRSPTSRRFGRHARGHPLSAGPADPALAASICLPSRCYLFLQCRVLCGRFWTTRHTSKLPMPRTTRERRRLSTRRLGRTRGWTTWAELCLGWW